MKLPAALQSWLLKQLRGSWLAKKLDEYQTKRLHKAVGQLTEAMGLIYDYGTKEISRSNVYLKEE